MTHIEQAIRDAVEEGGYTGTDFYEGIADRVVLDLAQSVYFLDPAFWQALGKARGWPQDGKLPEKMTLGYWERERWVGKWHRFIDHLAEGKDAESFFSTL